jgi:hypothetical protein
MNRLGKASHLVYLLGFMAALTLSPKSFAQSPDDDFFVSVTFQTPKGTTVISDKFSINDLNLGALPVRTTMVSAGYVDNLVFSFTHTATELRITYSGTVGNTAGTNVWSIAGPSAGSAVATSNQPTHDPKLGLLTEKYTATHTGAFSSSLIVSMGDQQFFGTINPMNAEGTLTYSTPTGINGAFAGNFSSNKKGSQFGWGISFSSPNPANNKVVDSGLFKKFDPRTIYSIGEGIELDSTVAKGNVSASVSDVSVAFVPEPSSLILGTVGFLGLGGAGAWRRWRRKVAVA